MTKLDEIQIQEASRALCEAMAKLADNGDKKWLEEKATSLAEALVAGLSVIRKSGNTP